MTTENGRHESQPAPAVDATGTTASSSGGLWYEILERLREVQESQARLAGAIHGLGVMVQDALGPEAAEEMAAHIPGTTLDPTADDPLLPPAPPVASAPAPPPATADELPPPPPDELPPAPSDELSPEPEAGTVPDADLAFKTSAPPADSLMTSVETSAQRAGSGATEVQEQLDATQVPEPVFYVPPFDEEVLPATSVAELTANALDEVLVSEFGPSQAPGTSASPSTTPGTVMQGEASVAPAGSDTYRSVVAEADEPAPRVDLGGVVPTADANKVLDILLGAPRTASEILSRAETSVAPDASHTNGSAPSPVVSSEGSLLAPPPPPPPPPVFTADVPPASSVFTAEPDAAAPNPFVTEHAPPSPPPVFSEHVPTPPPPPVFSEQMPPASSVFTAEPEPAPAETASVADEVEPPQPVFTSQGSPQSAPTEVPESGEAPLFSFGEPPAPHLAVPPSLPTPAPWSETAPFVTGNDPTATLLETPYVTEAMDEDVAEAESHVTSAASMATEILAATPEIATVAVPETPESELISKDLTLIARGRKKRFRLH